MQGVGVLCMGALVLHDQRRSVAGVKVAAAGGGPGGAESQPPSGAVTLSQ